MTLLDAATARAVDRLAYRAHAFHRFAHHPLCGRYQTELIRLGRRTRICRGCALAALGGLCGVVAGLLSPPTLASTIALGSAGSLVGMASLVCRGPKLL